MKIKQIFEIFFVKIFKQSKKFCTLAPISKKLSGKIQEIIFDIRIHSASC